MTGCLADIDLLPHISWAAPLYVLVVIIFVPWVVLTKKEPTAAVAWCLLVILMPILGALIYWAFGHNYLLRGVQRRRLRHTLFRQRELSPREDIPRDHSDLAQVATRVRAFPPAAGNEVVLYHQTEAAFRDLLAAIDAAQQHVHLEYFILRSDATGKQLVELLTHKAKHGVEVRLLLDALGSLHFNRRLLRPLLAAGGKTAVFLPLNPVRSLIRVSLRNHRKITVIDGRIAFTGGMNIGDEYLGKGCLGYWRDSFLRVAGPAAGALQRVFCEDWEFATKETLGNTYFPELAPVGPHRVQVAASGPDQEINTIREIFFAAILAGRERVWIASPYVVPDAGLFDALRLARHRGVDVRVLSLARPDHYVSYYAGRYFSAELVAMGVRVYCYQRGMMHSKLVLVDDRWAFVGSANFDNRSLHLNFEVGCLFDSPALVTELEAAYLRDLEDSDVLDDMVLAHRTFSGRVLDNVARLFGPTL
jgi:cardiolipin synthase